MNKKVLQALAIAFIVLPACKQVPRIKRIPSLLNSEHTIMCDSAEIEVFAQSLSSTEVKPYIGFKPKLTDFGQPWLVTIHNKSIHPYTLCPIQNRTLNAEIVARFNRSYEYHAWYILPAMLPIFIFVTPMSYIGFILSLAQHAYGAASVFSIGLITPFAGAMYYEHCNNDTYATSLHQLHANLLPEMVILRPNGVLTGLIFLPISSTLKWNLEFANTFDQTRVNVNIEESK